MDRAGVFHFGLCRPPVIPVQRELVHFPYCFLLVRRGPYFSGEHFLEARQHGLEKPRLRVADSGGGSYNPRAARVTG